MKKTKLIACVTALCILLSSCIAYNYYDDNGNPVYKDYYHTVQFSYPKGWNVDNNEAGSLTVMPADDQSACITLNVVYDEITADGEDYIAEYAEDIKNTYIEAEIIDYGSNVNAAGNNYTYIKYKYTDTDGNRIYAYDVITTVSVLQLLGVARCNAEDAEKYDSSFDITLNSLTVFAS